MLRCLPGCECVAQEMENEVIRKTLTTAAVVMALPIAAQAQSLQYPGFYLGAEGGGTWMFQTSTGTPLGSGTIYPDIGWAAGGMVGYRSEEHTSELQSRRDLVCRLLLEKKKKKKSKKKQEHSNEKQRT